MSTMWTSSISLKQQILTSHRGQELVVCPERDPGKSSCLRLAFLLLFFPLHVLQPSHTSCWKVLVVTCRCYLELLSSLGSYCARLCMYRQQERDPALQRFPSPNTRCTQSEKGRQCTKRSGLKKRAEGTTGVKVFSDLNQQDCNCIQFPALSQTLQMITDCRLGPTTIQILRPPVSTVDLGLTCHMLWWWFSVKGNPYWCSGLIAWWSQSGQRLLTCHLPATGLKCSLEGQN